MQHVYATRAIYFAVSFLAGLVVGVFLDFMWRNTRISKYEKHLEALEHYHWGLMLLTTARTLLSSIEISLSFVGVGIILIIVEIVQDHPFALGSNHQLHSTIIGVILFSLSFIIWQGWA